MIRRIDVNCDIGETSLPWHQSHEPALMRLITSANVACGGHAGDESSMREVCREAHRVGIRIGAQVSYPDRERFGRVVMEIDSGSLAESLNEQFEALVRAAAAESTCVSYVKPHGALYNVVVTREDHARVVVDLAARHGVGLFGLDGSMTHHLARRAGVPFVREWFADRGYMNSGQLAPRSRGDALVTSNTAIRDRVVQLIRHGTVQTVEGGEITVEFETICVHSDTPGAVSLLDEVRRALTEFDIAVGAS